VGTGSSGCSVVFCPPPLSTASPQTAPCPPWWHHGSVGTSRSAPQNPDTLTPQHLSEAFLGRRMTQAGGQDRGTHPLIPERRGWRKGKALAGLGPRGLSAAAGSCRAHRGARDPPAAQDWGKGPEAGCFGRGRGADRWRGLCERLAGAGGRVGRLSPMGDLGLVGLDDGGN